MPYFVSDSGDVFDYVCRDDDNAVEDISSATTLAFRFLKPDRLNYVDVTAAFVTDGTDGALDYTSISGLLDTAGWWEYWPILLFGSDQRVYPPRRFYVHPVAGT